LFDFGVEFFFGYIKVPMALKVLLMTKTCHNTVKKSFLPKKIHC
jgi:hypothetical protein